MSFEHEHEERFMKEAEAAVEIWPFLHLAPFRD